jgi:hypothetical protein
MDYQTVAARAARTLLACLATAAAIGLTACGPAFDNSFNTAFDKKTHDSCLPAAQQHGATAAQAEAYCSCVVAQLDKLSVQQKMGLNGNSPELQQAANACNAQPAANATSADAGNAASADADNAPMGGAPAPTPAPAAGQ